MHIPDGLLEMRVLVPLAAASCGAIAYAARRARPELGEHEAAAPLMGVMGAFVFAAQMVNFPLPIPGAAVSGHVLGGPLAAVLLGPHLATLAIAAVLIVQALLFQDGGIYALGANIFNMGLVATFLGYGLFRGVRRLLRPLGAAATPAAAFAAAWLSIELAALAAYLEIAASRPEIGGSVFLGAMLGFHALIGLVEGAVTAAAIGYVRSARPDLVLEALPSGPVAAECAPGAAAARAFGTRTASFAVQGFAAAAVVAGVLSLFASEYRDGLEAALYRAGARETEAASPISAPFTDYKVPVDAPYLEVSLAGLAGVAAVTALVLGVARALRGGRKAKAA